MDWFSKNLGDAMLAGAELNSIEEQFKAAFTQVDRPGAMAVFMRHESEGRLHCEVKIYFSPAAAAVASAVGAEPCTKPSPVGLDLLAGAEAARQALFPDS